MWEIQCYLINIIIGLKLDVDNNEGDENKTEGGDDE